VRARLNRAGVKVNENPQIAIKGKIKLHNNKGKIKLKATQQKAKNFKTRLPGDLSRVSITSFVALSAFCHPCPSPLELDTPL
jgi:hypothetical protein